MASEKPGRWNGDVTRRVHVAFKGSFKSSFKGSFKGTIWV